MSDEQERPSYARVLAPRQSCRVLVLDTESGAVRLVHESTDVLFEAPNWTRDGDLILNGSGRLWRLPSAGGEDPQEIPLDAVPELNNDHVLAPDGEHIYLSANDGHIYRAPLSGGRGERVTHDRPGRMHFLHGVSPDGRTLAYIAVELVEGGFDGAVGHVHAVSTDGMDDRPLTTGDRHSDGSEYSPDGEWIYLNTELFSALPGHAQIARMRPDGTGMQQLTFDDRVNWFPHLAPAGDRAVYLSFPSGTLGHPADLAVQLRLVRGGDWSAATVVAELPGGQGTINVNSWASDGRRFAFVDYPVAADADA
jgi:Tol biopolymer transport system component